MLSHLNHGWRVVSRSNGESEKSKAELQKMPQGSANWRSVSKPRHLHKSLVYRRVVSLYTHATQNPRPKMTRIVFSCAQMHVSSPSDLLYTPFTGSNPRYKPLYVPSITWMHSRNTWEGAREHTHTQRLCPSPWHLLADTRTKMSCRRVIK